MRDAERRLVETLRSKGSFESARAELTERAGALAEKISRAVEGGTPWKFDTTSDFARTLRRGSRCDGLPGDIALKPDADPVVFDPPFTADEFRIAVGVVRRAAADLGATEESSLFDESTAREYLVSGNGYRFRILQMTVAVLTVAGDCHLLEKVIDLPPGQLP